MRRTIPFVVIVAIGTMAAASQALPDFTGRWALVTPAAEPATTGAGPRRGDMGSGWGPAITITQDASRLVVEQQFFSRYDLQPPLTFVFALDGSETRNTVMMSHTADVRISHAAWQGRTLVLTTVYPFTDPASGQPLTSEVTQRLSLESPTTLVVDVTRSGVLGGRATTARAMYRKEM